MTKYFDPSNELPKYSFDEYNVIYLGGPIRRAPYWQKNAVRLLDNTAGVVLNPRRPGWIDAVSERTENPLQSAWEERAARLAHDADNGVLLFWFPKPLTEASNYGTLAWMRASSWLDQCLARRLDLLLLGVEPGYVGHPDVIKRYEKLKGREVYTSLEDVVGSAKRVFTGDFQ